MKVIFITMECADPIFSGNGTYSRSIIRSILNDSEVSQLLCISALPTKEGDDKPKNNADLYPADWNREKFSAELVPVPSQKWYRLDMHSAWEEFAAGAQNINKDTILSFGADLVVGVDWSATRIYEVISKFYEANGSKAKQPPYVFSPFRAYHTNPGLSDEEKQFYIENEYKSCNIASQVITLSRNDANSLSDLLKQHKQQPIPPIDTVLPPISSRIQALAREYTPDYTGRKYILCCVRLSVEKNVQVYVEVCKILASFFAENNIIPYMCGAGQSATYTTEIREQLRSACPDAIMHDFVPADKLAEIYKKGILNFHPAIYEAYGLTIAEAAVFGAPSLIHNGGGIGVAELLDPKDELFTTDLTDPNKAALAVKEIITNTEKRIRVAEKARAKSIAWGETENGSQFCKILKSVNP